MRTKTKPRTETIKYLTYFSVQTYKVGKGGGISTEPQMQARDAAHAERLFERYKPIRAGVVAFWRLGDPRTEEWEDAVIMARHGRLSPEFDLLRDEQTFKKPE